jgi:hypothetical protein
MSGPQGSFIMAIVPRTQTGRLQFYRTHLVTWTGIADQIGLTPLDVTALGTKVTAAQSALDQVLALREQVKAATGQLHEALAAMDDKGAALIALIRGFAASTNDVNVYYLAQIPAPKTPTPAPAPGTAYAPAVQLQQGGALQLNWRCNNPADAQGTVYEVYRQIAGEAKVQVGTVGEKKFTDDTLPAGTPLVTYTIIAMRSTQRGPAAQFNVQFGAGAAPAGSTPAGGTPAGGMQVSTLRPAA